jgi:hypothetical protein
MLSVTLREFLRRLPGIKLAGPATHEPSTFVNALTSLPVEFNPTR